MTRDVERRWRLAVTAFVVLAAIVTLASALTPTLPGREDLLAGIEPGPAQAVAHVAAVLGALALLALTPGIVHGRRRAGRAAISVLCVVAAVHVAKGLDVEEAAIALGVAAVVRSLMAATDGGGGPPRATIAVMVVVGAIAAMFAICLTVLADQNGPGPSTVVSAAASATWGLLEGDATAIVRGAVAHLLHVLLAVAALAAALAVRATLAPARPADGHDEAEHERAARLVAEHGDDSISPFVLRADKAFFFAHGGVLAYRTLGGTAVVSGDPAGPPGSAPAILRDFIRHAARQGWDVVVMAAAGTHLEAYRALGLCTMQIGLEAVARPGALRLAGGRHKSLRKAVNRVERRGWTTEVHSGAELDVATLRELAAIEREWATGRRRHFGFSMAMDRLWGAPEDARDLYVLGRDPAGALHGFLRFVPYRRGLSLDAMRRTGDTPNGFTESMVVASLRHAAALGCAEVSLNFAGFAHIMAADAILGRGGRLLRVVLKAAHGRFQLERLAQFNERFDPVWRPRHLVFTSRTRLPLAALRVLQAEAYVKPPRARPRQDAWRPYDAVTGAGAATGAAG